MSDPLDRIIGRIERPAQTLVSSLPFAPPLSPKEAAVEQVVDRMRQTSLTGGSISDALAQGQRETFDAGRKLGLSEGIDGFAKFRSQFGEAAARAAFREKMPEWKSEHKQTLQKLKSLKCRVRALDSVIAHATSANTILKDIGFHFKSRPFIVGNARLRAHEALEQINSPARELLLGFDTEEPKTKEAFQPIHHLIRRAEKFDIRSLAAADIAPNADFSHELEQEGLFVAPYPDCWFEWDIEPGHTIAGIVEEVDSGGYRFSSLVRVAGHGWANWDYLPPDAPNRCNDLTNHVAAVCRAAIVILASRGTERTPVAAPEKLNASRQKIGAPPLFSHTVVEVRGIVLDHTGVESGRTHRSPRMHWRRGHLRRFRNSAGEIYRVTPIAPMLVGRAELGKIEHDYMLTNRARTAGIG